MFGHNLFKDAKILRVKPDGSGYTVAAGTSDTLTSETIDTLGYEGVSFVAAVGTVTGSGTATCKLQQSSDDGVLDDYTDLAGSSNQFVGADDNAIRITEVYRPNKRYLKHVITRATANSVIDGLYVILWKSLNVAVTQPTIVAGSVFLKNPAEGTP